VFIEFGKAVNAFYAKHEITAYHHVIACHAFGQLKELLSLSKVSQQGLNNISFFFSLKLKYSLFFCLILIPFYSKIRISKFFQTYEQKKKKEKS
jgi:hypothetical protein